MTELEDEQESLFHTFNRYQAGAGASSRALASLFKALGLIPRSTGEEFTKHLLCARPVVGETSNEQQQVSPWDSYFDKGKDRRREPLTLVHGFIKTKKSNVYLVLQ